MSGELPRVSVIIATRDRPAYLAKAIKSVLAGEFQDFEIIVTDDAGVPENREVAEAFKDSRILYRRNSTCLQSARNHCAAARVARGEYIAILNDDDEWEPSLLATLLPLVERYSVAVAFGDHHVMDADGIVSAAASQRSSRKWKRDRLAEGIHRPFQRLAIIDQSLAMQAALIRRSALDWNDCPAEVGPLYDLWLSYLLCRNGAAAYYVGRRLARYRVHLSSSTSAGGARTAAAMVFVYSRMLADSRLCPWRREIGERLRAAKLTYALTLIESNEACAARQQIRGAVYPGQLARAGLSLALSWMPAGTGATVLRILRRIGAGRVAAMWWR
jgi:glycosyltransferase involved in cell wall biosynthesis